MQFKIPTFKFLVLISLKYISHFILSSLAISLKFSLVKTKKLTAEYCMIFGLLHLMPLFIHVAHLSDIVDLSFLFNIRI